MKKMDYCEHASVAENIRLAPPVRCPQCKSTNIESSEGLIVYD